MTLKITVRCDNAAFDDLEAEAARILREAAAQVERGCRAGRCFDGNGNHVGAWSIS